MPGPDEMSHVGTRVDSHAAPTRGRPRDPETDTAILAAALRLIGELGYDRMSMEAVAAAAGVGKMTVYRRYRDKADLASAAVAHMTDWGSPPDTGDIRQDLVQTMQNFYRYFKGGRPMCTIGSLLVEERHNPELIKLFRARVIRPRRRLLATIIKRGMASGAVRADADIEHIVDLLAGAYFARYLAGLSTDRRWAEKVVDSIWRGMAAGSG